MRDAKTLNIFALSTSALLAFLLLGRIILSGFSILDDHNIIGWLGPDNRLHASDIGHVLISTEIGSIGHSDRFRPFYFLQMVTEAWAFGVGPTGYHAVQILGFFVLLWAVAWACFRSVGLIVGAAVLFAIIDAKFWGDLWTYSFVPEQSAVFGVALVIASLGVLFRRVAQARDFSGPFLLFALGVIVAEGSKENFIFLVIPFASAAAFGIWQRRLAPWAIVLGILASLVMAVEVYGVVYPNLGRPTDFYGFDNSIGHRLQIMTATSITAAGVLGMIVAVALGAWGSRLRAVDHRTGIEVTSCAVIVAACSLYLFWEIFFYNGRLSSGIRYDFPSAILYPAAVAAIYYAFLSARRRGLVGGGAFAQRGGQAVCAFAIVLIGLSLTDAPLPIVQAVRHSNTRTNLMISDLASIRSITSRHPDWPILVVPSNPYDYESALTAPIWFKKFDVVNPMVMAVDVPEVDVKSAFERSLVSQLESVSTRGLAGRFDQSLERAQQQIVEHHCFEVIFRGAATRCERLPYAPASYLPIE